MSYVRSLPPPRAAPSVDKAVDLPWTRAAGKFVLLYPLANGQCRQAAADYRTRLTGSTDFDAVTLVELVAALRYTSDANWVGDLYDRYLNPAVLAAASVPPWGAS